LLGYDPIATDRLWHNRWQWSLDFARGGIMMGAMSGIDMALLDLKGKSLGMSVSELIGGRYRDSFPCYPTGTDNDITAPLLESDIPAMFTMIGSPRASVGAMKSACTNIKHFSVELGGNAPVVVDDDADIDAAATSIVDLNFAHSGQVCVSPNRCFVHESVLNDF
jgi:L-alanine-DL-glutamate epimerase-like enolase superfamily enzyme